MPQLPQDIVEFLHAYADTEHDSSEIKNLQFYMNQRRCQPDAMFIDEIHERWHGKYDLLEVKHGYIQWL